MSAISNFLTFLRSAIYAIDVRDGIADAIEQCYNDVNNPTLKTEALEAALQTKIDEGEMAALTIGDHTITAAKLAQGVIDNTLATSGAAADAKKTGDEITALKADLAHKSLSDEVKAALLNCFVHAAWVDSDGPNCYASLYEALYPNASLDHITAVFTQGSFVVEPETPLNALKPYLTVTAHYKDGVSITTTGYVLSGTLTAGTSTVTVTKDGKTASFNVTVTNNPALIYKLPSGTNISNQAIDTNVPVFGPNEDFTILIKAHVNNLPNDNNTKYLLNHGYLATGTLRLGLIFNANYETLSFITNVMYNDGTFNVSITGSEYECDVMYVVRMNNKFVTKMLYIDGVRRVNKSEDISSHLSGKTFTGDYFISAFNSVDDINGFFPGVVNFLAIYNSALTDDKIESIMGIEI